MSIHGSVVSLLVSLGYTSSPGCCHGVSLRWLEACLLDEEPLFDARIQQIVSGGEALVHSINAVKEKKGQNLTVQDKALLDIQAFYDSLELYHSPRLHFSLFNASLMQNNVDLISNIASSDAILSRGGLTQIYSEPVIYTKNEIKAYLDGLGVVIEAVCSQSKEPLGIVLLSYNHTIALTYTPGKGWSFMDINQYPSKLFMVNETDLLAERIMSGFIQSNSPYSAFNVSVFTTRNHMGLLNLQEAFDLFKKSHSLTNEMANREADGIGLALIAAENGHESVIAELAKQGVDLNKADIQNMTPAYIAAQNGHASVIAELAKHQVSLNQAISDGATPVFIAAQEGHISVIAELIKIGVNLNTPYIASVASLKQFALSYGDKIIERMNDFIDQQLVLSPTSQTLSMTPSHIAVVMGYREIVQLLDDQEGPDQNEPLNASHQRMELTQPGHDRTIGDGYAFFSSSVQEGREPSDAYQESGKKRKLGELDDEDVPENDKKRSRSPS